jgi:hypothetical protein
MPNQIGKIAGYFGLAWLGRLDAQFMSAGAADVIAYGAPVGGAFSAVFGATVTLTLALATAVA